MYFDKILIANRGEIAVRIIRACHDLNIAAVAVYSEADRTALHVRLADEAFFIGPASATESYLHAERIIEAAYRSGAQAIHPGYGFLSERAHFARACQSAGLIFIGPPAEVIDLMGSKIAAKHLAQMATVPTVPGYMGDNQQDAHLRSEARVIGFPLLIKASAGGGGKGMRTVRSIDEFDAALEGARREARAAFGDDTVFLERLIERPHHVEIQVLADAHQHCVHLFERECSIQRRHQKIVEEAPSPMLTPEVRSAMGDAAVRLARAAHYCNAGTIEFLLDAQGNYYFLEMNTRLQVEHPVTELIAGVDLVQLQIAIAAGERLPFTQEQLALRGHAIEMRVYAEDPGTFLPASGHMALFVPPIGPGIRNDVGIVSNDEVTVHYDPMLAKLIVVAPNRPAAVRRIRSALVDYTALGVTTNLPLLRAIADHPAFERGTTTTDFLNEHQISVSGAARIAPEVLIAAALVDCTKPGITDPWQTGPWRLLREGMQVRYRFQADEYSIQITQTSQGWHATIGESVFEVAIVAQQPDHLTWIYQDVSRMGHIERFVIALNGDTRLIGWRGDAYQVTLVTGLSVDSLTGHLSGPHGHASLEAPMPGTVIKVLVREGEVVVAHQPLLVLEAMKMEHIVAAPHDGVIQRLPYGAGALVAKGSTLVELEETDLHD